MCRFSFSVRPFWNPQVITTAFENDKKSGEVWAVLPNNRLFMLLRTANCKTCYDGITCTVPVFAKICSAPSCAFLYLVAEIGSRARVRNCVRFQNRGNSCRASLEIWYSLASCTPPHLSRTMEPCVGATLVKPSRNGTPRMFYFVEYPPIVTSRYFIEGLRTVLWDHECDVEEKMLCSTSNIVYLKKIRFSKPKSRYCLVNIFLVS